MTDEPTTNHHPVEITLMKPVPIATHVKFVEPGSGIVHSQEVASYIPQGTVIIGTMKLEVA